LGERFVQAGRWHAQFEYLFDLGKIAWAPIYDPDSALVATLSEEDAQTNEPALLNSTLREGLRGINWTLN
jgi:hypothetical protein